MRSDFLRPFFQQLSESSVAYAVVRNHEGLPDAISGTDIDILIAPTSSKDVRRVIDSVCTKSSWGLIRTAQKDFRITNYILFSTDEAGQTEFIALDVMTSIGWRGYQAWRADEILRHQESSGEIVHLSKAAEAAVTTFTSLAYAGEFKKDKYSSQVQEIADSHNLVFVDLMTSVVGEKSFAEIAANLSDQTPIGIVRAAKSIRSSVKSSARKKPFRFLLNKFWSLRFRLRRFISPPGILIAVIGTDGSGKSTLVESISDRLQPVFGASDTAHLRPRLLPNLSNIAGTGRPDPDNTGYPSTHTRSPGLFGSLLRWFYYWFDYLIGYQLVFRPQMAKKSVIVIDRYYYDFEFDHGQKNVKLPGWLIRSMQRLLPSPEIVIHVDTDTASVLSRRSDEVDEQEIDRQRTALKSITKRLRSAGTVDGSQSSESATNQALEVIVRVLSKDRLS